MIALVEDPLEVAVQIFYVRGGRIRGQRGWVADRTDEGGTPELVQDFLLQLYGGRGRSSIPREVLVPALPPDTDVLEQLLSERRGSKVAIRVPQRGDKRDLQQTVANNAAQALALHKTKRASDLTTRNRALEEIQQSLGLDEVPLRIECYDVSNLQGTEVVASMVVFEDGLSRKSEYRRFVIRGVDGQNDVASMHEVITRRFQRLLDEQARSETVATDSGPMLVDPETGRPRKFAYAPSLVVVDGGPPQVAAAQQALAELGINDIPVCGLAKRLEEVWLPGEEDPVIMARTSEGLYLLQRIRDEAHRFAITHHRNRRSKSMVESTLDDVPGLGEVRRKTLLKHFGSLKKLREADVGRRSPSCPASGRGRPRAIKDAVAKADATRKTARQGADGQHRHRRAPGRTRACSDRADARRARHRHRHDRCRSQHGGQGARGPRLLRGRQPPADAGARRRAPRRRQPRHRTSRSRWWSTSGRARSSTPSRPTATSRSPAAPRRCCSSRRPTRCSSAARRPPAVRTRSRAGGRLLHGLQRERGVMADLRGDADVLLDTSNFNVHQLQDRIAELFGTAATTRLKVTVISFGFKYGIPVDADWVADMRFLPNPHWVPELRPQNGRDPDVVGLRAVPARRGAAPRAVPPRPRDGRARATSPRASASCRSPSAAPAASTAASR